MSGPALMAYRGLKSFNERAIDRLGSTGSYKRSGKSRVRSVPPGHPSLPKDAGPLNPSVVGLHLQHAVNADDLPGMLDAVASHETLRRAAHARAGRRVCDLLSSDEGLL